MKRYQVFLDNQHISQQWNFPVVGYHPKHSIVYDRSTRQWWLMDETPLHINSVPKETRAMALLLGIA